MFVLKENFPINAHALKELLNSDLMQFIFESLFKTHKILRKDLECLPLFAQFINNSFDEKFYLKNLGIEKKTLNISPSGKTMHVACLLALGDNLITLSLLKEIAFKQQLPLKILGTRLTLKIARLLECEKHFEIIPLFENVPAFYDLKNKAFFGDEGFFMVVKSD